MDRREMELKNILGEEGFLEMVELPSYESIDVELLKILVDKVAKDVTIEEIVEGVEIMMNFPKTIDALKEEISLEILKNLEWNGLSDEDASVALIFAKDMYSCTEVAVRSLWEVSREIVPLGGCKKAAARAKFTEMFEDEISVRIENNLVVDWDKTFDKMYQNENIQAVDEMYYYYCD